MTDLKIAPSISRAPDKTPPPTPLRSVAYDVKGQFVAEPGSVLTIQNSRVRPVTVNFSPESANGYSTGAELGWSVVDPRRAGSK